MKYTNTEDLARGIPADSKFHTMGTVGYRQG